MADGEKHIFSDIQLYYDPVFSSNMGSEETLEHITISISPPMLCLSLNVAHFSSESPLIYQSRNPNVPNVFISSG